MNIEDCASHLSAVGMNFLNALRNNDIYNDIDYKSTLFNAIENGLTFDFTQGLSFSVSQGSENIYLELSCYDNSAESYKEYKIKFYSKDNHEGIKTFIKLIIENL